MNNNNKSNDNYVWPVRAGEWKPRKNGKTPPHFSFENLYASYRKCRKHKRSTINALKFEINAEQNLFNMQTELLEANYKPTRSVCFVIDRPKMREIVAADFRDRIVHHLLVERLEAIYEPIFIHDAYACRKGKGLHRAITRVREFIRKGGKNGRRKLYFIHLDIQNFFMSIDKHILFKLLQKKVRDSSLIWLSKVIIFHNPVLDCVVKGKKELIKYLPPHKSLFHLPDNKGLPIGNLTSQFFANLYLNELDQYVKHKLKYRYYLRYCDDFLLFSDSFQRLLRTEIEIQKFLSDQLKLNLNQKYSRALPVQNGIDFLGYIIRPNYLLVRQRVVNHMKTKLQQFEKDLISVKGGFVYIAYRYEMLEKLRAVIASYFGHFKWANTHTLKAAMLKRYGFLEEFFEITEKKINPLYRFQEVFPSVRSQYHYFAHRFAKNVVFMQVGIFYEFYSEKSPIPNMFKLKQLKPNKRGAKYGFPVYMGKMYAQRAASQGMPVVIVNERDHYIGRIKCRLPNRKIMAA